MRPKQQKVWDKTNGRCWYCGTELIASKVGTAGKAGTVSNWFAVDHLFPKSRGGSNDLENLVPACFSCNSSKRHKTVEHFRQWLEDEARNRNNIIRQNKLDLETADEIIVFWGERSR